MKIILPLTIFINIVTLIAFILGYFYELKENYNPRIKATIGILIGYSFLAYLISVMIFITLNLFNQNYLSLLFLAFLIIPFIIGKLVKYETLLKYSLIQIFCLLLSLAGLFYILIF